MTTADVFEDTRTLPPSPTRKAALERLKAFAPRMGRAYAERRNYDPGPDERSHVSGLSAHVRHRLVTEGELVETALKAHGLNAAEKFIQETCWRTYWKGWLDQRPSVWADYRFAVTRELQALEREGGLLSRYEEAIEGRTGIACFDAWARELIEHGYLHNHARMWFASIWVYTLDLPWALGADFFLRHLMDGDPASNTLSWRWVCGLQTRGKTYLARASNIERFTGGRFSPGDGELAPEAPPLDPEPVHPDPAPLGPAELPDPDAPSLILVHDEDGHAESWKADTLNVRAVAGLAAIDARSPLGPGARALAFTLGALDDSCTRAAAHFGAARVDLAEPADLVASARDSGVRQVVTQRPHAGPLADRLSALRPALEAADVRLVMLRRDWDRAFYPHANRGFFKLKKQIPSVLAELGLT